jgi:glutathione synthase/RimK-type ligase-like ATP-grasp enzyme
MHLAIHRETGSFSDRWIAYCDEHRIPYTLVNCLDADIISQVKSVDALLWHWHYPDPAAVLLGRQLMLAVEAMGLVVFPSPSTSWHYDDKVGQKYLLEAVGAPLVPSYVFYNLTTALDWIESTTFPKVFKLRIGAGSANVRLVNNADEARALAKQAFTIGFQPIPSYSTDARKRWRVARQRKDLWSAVKRIRQALATIRRLNRMLGRERGYIYFQDFVPGNVFDTRVTVIGNRAFVFTRNVRPGDFRASGSGDIVYDRGVHARCVPIAFDVARRVGSQSLAFDFVMTPNQQPKIVEISYCYAPEAIYRCAGHWDDQLTWHDGHMWPQDAILLDLLDVVRRLGASGPQVPDRSVCGVRTVVSDVLAD